MQIYTLSKSLASASGNLAIFLKNKKYTLVYKVLAGYLLRQALTNPTKGGLGSSGLDLNSGWNWVARKNG